MLHSIHKKQLIKSTISELWGFISDPANLAIITPPEMNFKVLSELRDEKMHPGQIIEYQVSPLLGLKMHWVTEITHVKTEEYFVDEQRFGPYTFWHHQHSIKQTSNGIEMQDDIHYKIPMGAIGRSLNKLFIAKKLEHIFEYRKKKLDELFPN
ncbi:MAG: SRPBCC family protein [Bacteroidia bacterium]|nr:SRPBCC family protein [Bacteroidia bacterium]